MNTNDTEILKEYPEILTAKMIAEILDISYVNALKVIRFDEDIRYIRIGNVYKIPKKGFINWLNSDVSRDVNLEN